MKKLLGKVKTVKVPFMDETVEVSKLTVAQVKEFQKELGASKSVEDEESGLKIQRTIIRMAVVDAAELTDDELDSFPLVELTKLTQKILELAGVAGTSEGNDSPKKS
jgi:hypothetical protein